MTNSRTEFVRKKNPNCEKSKTQIVTKLKNYNCDSKTQIVTKLKNSTSLIVKYLIFLTCDETEIAKKLKH